jgi:hypothetical protein
MMLGFYLDLPAWVRAIAAVVVLGTGVLMTVYGYLGRPKFSETKLPDGHVMRDEKPGEPYADMSLYCGMAVTATGAALLAACGRSDAEKHGYNF